MTRPLRSLALLTALTAVVSAGAASAAPASSPASSARWIAGWAAPLALTSASSGGPATATVRNVARLSIGGAAVRIRLSNPTSTPLRVSAASIGLQQGSLGAALVPGSSRPITFHGKAAVTVPPRTSALYSDATSFPARAQRNVAVSLYLPSASNPDIPAATRNTSYRTADRGGNATQQTGGGALSGSTMSTYALTAVDVRTTEAVGAVVGIGSSTFHGTGSTTDGYDRVLDVLARRVHDDVAPGHQLSVISAGIDGDTLHAGLGRLTRDVLTQTGVKGVMVYDVNDLATRSAQQVETDYRTLIELAHGAGVKVYCPTRPPAAQSLPSQVKSNERNKLNAWILQSRSCDDVVDWDSVLRGGVVTQEYDPEYRFDGIHPNTGGHHALAMNTPISWLRR